MPVSPVCMGNMSYGVALCPMRICSLDNEEADRMKPLGEHSLSRSDLVPQGMKASSGESRKSQVLQVCGPIKGHGT